MRQQQQSAAAVRVTEKDKWTIQMLDSQTCQSSGWVSTNSQIQIDSPTKGEMVLQQDACQKREDRGRKRQSYCGVRVPFSDVWK